LIKHAMGHSREFPHIDRRYLTMEKSEFKELKEQLLSTKKNGYDILDAAGRAAMEDYCAGYKRFLDAGKTERLCAAEAVRLAEEAGYRPYSRGMLLKAGDKVYVRNRGKAVMLAHIGEKPLDQGIQLAAAHIDSPRLDLKPTPLYEDSELAYFKTHYYGGIRKYQWVTIPLALHGVVILKDGTKVTARRRASPGWSSRICCPTWGPPRTKSPWRRPSPARR
jgi:hypothetical protein